MVGEFAACALAMRGDNAGPANVRFYTGNWSPRSTGSSWPTTAVDATGKCRPKAGSVVYKAAIPNMRFRGKGTLLRLTFSYPIHLA